MIVEVAKEEEMYDIGLGLSKCRERPPSGASANSTQLRKDYEMWTGSVRAFHRRWWMVDRCTKRAMLDSSRDVRTEETDHRSGWEGKSIRSA